jgi:transcriptional regulator with PAS, ATPase and Fis domain
LRKKVTKSRSIARKFGTAYEFDDIIGDHPLFVDKKKTAQRLSRSDSTILLSGESGTGKELFAQSIHAAGSRASGPFVSLNCAAIPAELFASELFGYVGGSFTGALKTGAKGKFELAQKGTLFLDEIAEIPLRIQPILLRAMEEREVYRLGGAEAIAVDVRIIAATNRDLKKMVEAGKFRTDLYYRLNVVQIVLPPLREHLSDVPVLVKHILADLTGKFGWINPLVVSDEAMSVLQACQWAGNIRELRNVLERSVNLCTTGRIEAADLPWDIRQSSANEDFFAANQPFDYEQLLRQSRENRSKQEERRIHAALLKHNGNKSKVAEELGISRQTLYRKMRSLIRS